LGISISVTVITQLIADGPLLLSFTYLLLISFSLMSFRFHYLSSNPIGSRSLWSVLGGGGRESPVKHGTGGGQHGRGRTGWGGGAGGGGPGGGKLDGCIMHQVHTSHKDGNNCARNVTI